MRSIEEILEIKVSYQIGVKSHVSRELTVKEVLSLIQANDLKETTFKLRKLKTQNQDEEYKEQKKNLPAVTFCGTFKISRSKDTLKEYNSLMVLDIDELTGAELQKYKSCFVADEYVISFWESPSGKGLKGLVSLEFEEEMILDGCHQLHRNAFSQLADYFKQQYAIKLDESGKDIPRLCFLSYDQDIHIKTKAKAFFVSKVEEIDKGTANKSKLYSGRRIIRVGVVTRDCLLNPCYKNSPLDRYKMQSILKFLTKRNKSITFEHCDWIRTAYAIANTFTYDIGEKYFLRLCQQDLFKYDENICKNILKNCYANSRGEISFSSILYLARNQGYKPKREDCREGGKIQDVV